MLTQAASASRPTLLAWSVLFVVGFALLAASGGSSKERRSHFWVRVLLLPILPAFMPELLSLVASLRIFPDGTVRAAGVLLALVFVMALMFVPALLYRTSGSSPGASDDGGGGGSGPGPPPVSPNHPRGVIPLLDAEQARARVRDHASGRDRRGGSRRRTREPERRPTRKPVGKVGR